MPLDDLADCGQELTWPEIDCGLLYGARPAAPAFPLDLLPAKWRAWVEASAQSFIHPDYLVQALLGAASAVLGGGVVVRLTDQWAEPLVLWQAMVGGPATGKSAALAAGKALVEAIEPRAKAEDPEAGEEAGHDAGPTAVGDGSLNSVRLKLDRGPRGVSIWREELAGWLETAALDRPAWIGAWSAESVMLLRRGAMFPFETGRFPVGIVGTLRPERLTEAFAPADDDSFASRFLYAWPEPVSVPSLASPPPDVEGVRALLQRIANLAYHPATPGELPLKDEAALAQFESLLPILRQQMREADSVEAAWIGRGPSTIARLAALLRLMEWAQDETDERPDGVQARQIDHAHELWAGYFLPHAQAVFGAVGATERDRLAARAARWLKRQRVDQVSLRDIRRYALGETVDGEGADDIIQRLETAGVLRPLPPSPSAPSGGRPKRRWAVNPALQ